MKSKVIKNSFDGQSFYVGIDVHKKSWKVSILTEHYEHKTFSQNPDPEKLADYLHRNFPNANYHAVYEAGFSGFSACRVLNKLGINCHVIHPADVPTSQKEKEQKTDTVDSRKLARILRSKEFNPIHIPDVKLESDRALMRMRSSLVKDISRIKNRIKSLLFQFGIDIPERFTSHQTRHWSKVYINWLENLNVSEQSLKETIHSYIRSGQILRKELLEVNKKVRLLSRSQTYNENVELLMSIPGIGIITAMELLTQIGDINRFKREDELCSYVGLIPKMHGSGERMVSGKMTRRGLKKIKISLIEISWIAIRKDPALMHKFNELCLKMPKNKAIIRIARKVLNRIRYVLRTKNKYVSSVIK